MATHALAAAGCAHGWHAVSQYLLHRVRNLQGLPLLSVLYIRGNPAVSAIRGYRKTLIARLAGLNYLDDRPVFETERLCAEAW